MSQAQESSQEGAAESLRNLLEKDPPADSVSDRVALHEFDQAAVVTLSRPEAQNALNLATWRRLKEIFQELASWPSLRAVVVRGAGPKAFAAGADIKEFPETRMTAADATDYNESISAALRAIQALPVPVIAAIQGLAVGGGCELATACDVRIATADSRFGIPIGKLGVILGYTESAAAARLIGPAALKYLLFTGKLISAEEAGKWGLVQEVVPADALAPAAADLVDRICRNSATTMRAAKAVADMHGRALTAADTELLTRLSVEAHEGADLKEGVAAFAERRAPEFGKEGSN